MTAIDLYLVVNGTSEAYNVNTRILFVRQLMSLAPCTV